MNNWPKIKKKNPQFLKGIEFNIPLFAAHKQMYLCTNIEWINSNEGYKIENIQWVHKDVNLMKQNLSEDKLFELCKQIVEYKKLK